MKHYRLGSHTKSDLKAHLVWTPKYRKRILLEQVAIRARDIIRQIAAEHEVEIISGKVSCDHEHLFINYRPDQSISKLVQYLKSVSSRILFQEFPNIRKQLWGRHFWVRGCFVVSSGTITDEMIQQYIDEQEGEPVQDGRFQIDS